MRKKQLDKMFILLPAFTLAEVLITLTIIGVIAALTIPALINNYQKQTYVTQLKKAYSQINEALKLLSIDKDCTDDLKCTGLFDTTTTNTTLGDELVKYLKIYKNCQALANQDCQAANTNPNYDGSDVNIYHLNEWGYYSFITADGASFLVFNLRQNCSDSVAVSTLGYASQYCGFIYVDVNGPQKGPNYMGRDTFSFFITNGKGALLYPARGMDDSNNWWKTNNGCSPLNKEGVACTARIIEENWQMNY